ncbi:MAG: FAD-dependent oxidoreductase [Hyphomicrobiaceae bacterium]
MESNPFDILFEPVRIGHLVARNRFYQAPHCNGMGNARPRAHAAMRGVKAEGGWAVVNTENCSVHPTSDLSPEVLQTLWDDDDIAPLALMSEAVHAHGSLAGIQLAYSCTYNANKLTRETPLGPMDRPVEDIAPGQVRAMDLEDIRNLRRWWRAAAERSIKAGFDIVNVDANFSTILFQFLSPRNTRSDEYGGSLANRVRLMRELIEETHEGVRGAAAISVRLIIDEVIGEQGLRAADEGLEAISLLAELPDLWDIVIGTWADDSPTARFAEENAHEPFMTGIKSVTTKPVVGVGRFTSPDLMAALVRRGVLDMIGAARPSIADPFLPQKIAEGRIEDIRECIGCNICVSSHYAMVSLRCTQNPTMGEEWRRGWHPERIRPADEPARVLVAGAGPAGLECARALGQRGYEVVLAEKNGRPGGRVLAESGLPGLSSWRRVADWRLTQIGRMANVALYLDSEVTADLADELEVDAIAVSTGARWRRDGVGMATPFAPSVDEAARILTPDDLLGGAEVEGPVLVYDDDHYTMGGALAELLARRGLGVTIATPASDVSAFCEHTLDMHRIARRLDGLGVAMVTHHVLEHIGAGAVRLTHRDTGRPLEIVAATVVLVTARLPQTALFDALLAAREAGRLRRTRSIRRIGDCDAPAAIVQAVYAGHRFAQELGMPADRLVARREHVDVGRDAT